MSKTLFILRHAKSDWSDVDLDDIKRPLKPRGTRDARLIGDWLHHYCLENDVDSMHALVSPAVRAATTYDVVARSLTGIARGHTRTEDMYMADSAEMLEMIRACNHAEDALMLVGHNPGMHDLVEELTSLSLDRFPTCAVACIEFDVRSWDTMVPKRYRASQFIRPKLLRS